ncbi:efflux RND transporter permease subunit, partial [Escherichia coli]|uniref:efflux RND transporter permease subunit n=1 Tax=Escherichia coli TaxID=562 RepID=UPI0011C88ECC
GTLVTIAGFLPVGFAASTAGEYAGNIFWVVSFSLIISWIVAVTFTPYLGVKLLPNIKRVEGGHDAIYASKNYQRLRRIVRMSGDHKWMAAGITVALFAGAVVAMGKVEQQFFPNSERAELIVEVTLPAGSAFATTEASVKRLESALRELPEAGEITSYV